MKRQQVTSKNLVHSFHWKSSKIRQQCCRSESFARITEIHMSVPTLKNHLSLTTVLGKCNTENNVPIVVSGLLTTSSSSSSSGSTSPTSLPQESTGSTPIPASIECESADEQARSNPSCNPTKDQNPTKMWTMNRYGATSHFPKYVDGCKNSKRILWMKSLLRVETHTRVLLMNPLWSRRDEWYRANTVFMLTSRKTEITRSARGLKLQGQRAEDVLVKSYLVQKILVTW